MAGLLPDSDLYLAQNSVLGHDERTEIVGKFSGRANDTLRICFAAEREYRDSSLFITLDGRTFKASGDSDENWHFLWDIKSAKGSVPALRVFGLCPKMVYEGDLDGNGTDEFGILFTWHTSACRTYEVYTFHEGEWRLLIPQVRTAESLRASGKELVKPGRRPGEVMVTMSDFDAPGSCCTVAPDKDTVITSTFEAIYEPWRTK